MLVTKQPVLVRIPQGVSGFTIGRVVHAADQQLFGFRVGHSFTWIPDRNLGNGQSFISPSARPLSTMANRHRRLTLLASLLPSVCLLSPVLWGRQQLTQLHRYA